MKKAISGLLLAVSLNYSSAHDVKICEIVPDPKSDHNGSGTITYLDEYISLVNNSQTNSYDLFGWKINFTDTTPESLTLTNQPNYTIGPGQEVVIMNPPGEINNKGEISLYDSSGTLIDLVNYGNWEGITNGIPNGNASSPADESLSLMLNGEWIKTYATPGQPNRYMGETGLVLKISKTGTDTLRIESTNTFQRIFTLQTLESLAQTGVWTDVYTNNLGENIIYEAAEMNVSGFYRAKELE